MGRRVTTQSFHTASKEGSSWHASSEERLFGNRWTGFLKVQELISVADTSLLLGFSRKTEDTR